MPAADSAGAPDRRAARRLRNLNALLELSREMAREIQLETLLPIIMQKTTEVLEADRSTLFLYDAEREELWSRLAQGLDAREIRFPASEGLAGYVARTRETVNIGDPYADPRFNPEVDRQTTYRTKSLLCMPIVNVEGELAGVIQVLNKKDQDAFDEEDEDLLAALASHVGVALERALLVESYAEQQRLRESLKVAREIQQSMLPQALPERLRQQPVEISARMLPAADVGGDFYDYSVTGEDSVAFSIGDVSGKGVPAALLMAVTRIVLRSFMLAGLPPEECLKETNALLYPECPRSMFVSALVGALNLRTGELTYSIAGHLPPFRLAENEPPQLLERTGGIALCLLPEFRYVTRQVTLNPGDSIFLYTDGLTEAVNRAGEMFGQERLAACLAEVSGTPPERVVQHAYATVGAFSTGMVQWDDLTTLAVRYAGGDR